MKSCIFIIRKKAIMQTNIFINSQKVVLVSAISTTNIEASIKADIVVDLIFKEIIANLKVFISTIKALPLLKCI